MTSRGREFSRGGNGGRENNPVFSEKSYLLCIESTIDNNQYLREIKCHYVDLNEVQKDFSDPLKKLIAESDLLSRGFEKHHTSALSEDTQSMIKDVEDICKIELIEKRE